MKQAITTRDNSKKFRNISPKTCARIHQAMFKVYIFYAVSSCPRNEYWHEIDWKWYYNCLSGHFRHNFDNLLTQCCISEYTLVSPLLVSSVIISVIT